MLSKSYPRTTLVQSFPNAPNWDIASTCTIRGEHGLLLVEAKAHVKELSAAGKRRPNPSKSNSFKNHNRIKEAICEANDGLRVATKMRWELSRDQHYQLSNRFAWSWKLAALEIPVVLVYLGFLNAREMADEGPLLRTKTHWAGAVKAHSRDVVDEGPLLRTKTHWAGAVKAHSRDVVDEACWGKWLKIDDVPFIPLIRGIDQSLDLDCEWSG